MNIKKPLLISYSAILIGIILVGIFTLLMTRYQRILTAKQEQRYASYLLADQLRQSSDDLTRMARTYVVTQDPKYEQFYWDILAIREGEKRRPQNYERIYWDLVLEAGDKPRPNGEAIPLEELMRQAGFTEAEFAKLREAQRNSDALVTTETIAMNAVKGLFDDGTGNYTQQGEADLEMARRIMYDAQYHANKAAIMQPIDDFFVLLDERTQAEVEEYKNKADFMLWLIQTILALLILLAIVIGIYITRKVLNPLERIIVQVQDSGIQLTTATTEISATGKELEATVTEQVASTQQVKTASLEIAQHSTDLVETMSEVTQMAQKTAFSANSSRTQLSQIEGVMDSLNEATILLSSKLEGMNEKANNINGVIATITKIADSTNLLSLNAAIEAEKAGEAGRGFAVVAREVSRLADSTAVSTLEIENTVREMQNSVHQWGTEMDSFHSQVAQTVQKVGGIGEEVMAVVEQVQTLIPHFEEVSQNTKQQHENAQKITLAMEQLTEASFQIADSIKYTNDALNNLDDVAQKLQQEISTFKVKGGSRN